MTTERWRRVPGYEGRYEVSDQGRVRSLTWTGGAPRPKPHYFSLKPAGSGYVTLTFQVDRVHRTFTVHRLVMAAFIGPCPDGQEVRHMNGVRADNRLENLQYGTRSENIRDAVQHGTHSNTRKTHCPKNHPYSAGNTMIKQKNGRPTRQCRICRHASDAAYRERMRARAVTEAAS